MCVFGPIGLGVVIALQDLPSVVLLQGVLLFAGKDLLLFTSSYISSQPRHAGLKVAGIWGICFQWGSDPGSMSLFGPELIIFREMHYGYFPHSGYF